jgi:hypothetical protein
MLTLILYRTPAALGLPRLDRPPKDLDARRLTPFFPMHDRSPMVRDAAWGSGWTGSTPAESVTRLDLYRLSSREGQALRSERLALAGVVTGTQRRRSMPVGET